MTECRVDTVIANIFRYTLLFGLATHLYDTKRHQLVYSPKALCYCLTVHIASVLLLPVAYQFFQNNANGYFEQIEGRSFEKLFLLLMAIQFMASFTSLVSQWTSRARAATLYNEIIQIWAKDMARLQWSANASGECSKIFTYRVTSTILIITATVVATVCNVLDLFSIAQGICMWVCSNIVIAVMFQFSSGMIFSDYLFRVLNHNLTRVVQEIGDLGPTQGRRRRVAELRNELTAIGRIHSQIQQWVVSFKNMYQIEVLFILMTFFLSQIFTLSLVCFVLHAGMSRLSWTKFLVVSLSALLCGSDLILHFYICGRVLDACGSTAHIMKGLPSHNLCCTRLERCVETMCLELKRAKLRLRMCGLVDVHGNTGFAMTEAAMMYIILLIQIDYKHF